MKSFPRIILCLLLFSCKAVFGPVYSQEALYLIPQPKEVKFGQGGFRIGDRPGIYVSDPSFEQTMFAARELADEISLDLGIDAGITHKFRKAQFVLGILNRDGKVDAEAARAGLSLPEQAKAEGYILHIAGKRVIVAAATETGLFYGVQTLKQLIRSNCRANTLPCLTVTDWPALRYRGWMDDISRGPIPTVEFLKQCIREMAGFKQNFFNLYTEHVFRLSKYPDLAPPGSLTAAEVEELSAYAAKYHIDLVGNFQSFGHMGKILSNPFYSHLGDNGDILNPADEETYSFLKDIYAEIVPAYKSPFFNINCDETFGLGEGRSKEMAKRIGLDGIYVYHINRLDKLLKPYGKRIMMWGDIAVGNPGIIPKLPKDLIVLSWGYHAGESFDEAILPFKKTGFDFMVAPGVSCWSVQWPGLSNASVNISNYVRDGAKLGAMGMMNTAWDDNGHNLFNSNWHGLTWGAECSWNPAPPSTGEQADAERNSKLKFFNSCFDRVFFKTDGITGLLFAIDSLRNEPVRDLVGEGAFWQDILDFNLENTNDDEGDRNLEVIRKANELADRIMQFRKAAPRNPAMLNNAILALKRIIYTADKNLARIILYQAKESGDEFSAQLARTELARLKNSLYEIKKDYIGFWQQENRDWWLTKNQGDYDNMARSLDQAGDVVFIEPASAMENGELPVALKTLFRDRKIIFTTDGSQPSPTSQVYAEPLKITGNTLVKACVLNEGATGKVTEKNILFHKGIGKLYKLHSSYSDYNPAYAAGGDGALVDGLKGSASFADGRWQAYQGQDLDIELDLGSKTQVHRVSVDFLQNSYSWILLPRDVELLASDDGVTYRAIRTITHTVPQQDQKTVIHTFEADFTNLETRYLRLVARNAGPLPEWHHAPGNPSFLFADEIIVE